MPESTAQASLKVSLPGIRDMFNGLSTRYDLLNRILSLGRDLFWREALARRIIILDQPGTILDLASGTGDQLAAIKDAHPEAKLTGLDFSKAMLDYSILKFSSKPGPPPDLILGDALELPFSENSFDSISIAFGLRNITKKKELYQEVLRVLKPGGRFLVLELFFDPRSLWAPIHRFHLATVTPWLAERLFKNQVDAYHYLGNSVLAFPHPAIIVDDLHSAGFTGLSYRTFTFHSCMLVWGHKAWPEK